MEPYQTEFVDFLMDVGVLSFGDFTTKSGRQTPYFINTGKYQTGSQMMRLGQFYAEAILMSSIGEFDVIFGPAYKGIPLVVATAIAFHQLHEQEVRFCFNRKEAKTHGERGNLIGTTLRDGDRVLIVEDVTTAGTSIRETVPLLRQSADIELAGLVVSVDRQERGAGEKGALDELAGAYNMPTSSIVRIDEVIEYLDGVRSGGRPVIDERLRERIKSYRATFGVAKG